VDSYDDASVAARLRSPIHCALVNVIGVTAPALGADAAAVRLYRGTTQATTDEACVLPPAGLTSGRLAEAEAWPLRPGSLFDQIRRSPLRDTAWRVAQRQDGWPGADDESLGALVRPMHVADAVAVTCMIREPTWCAAVFVRCGVRELFPAEAIAMLDRLRPTLAWAMLMGVQRATHVGLPTGVPDQPVRPRGGDVMGRLSDTERRVLDLLMQGKTEREAAEVIGRSPHTVHVHVKNVYRKLNVTSRRQLRTLVESSATAPA
jgi:DNA-binding CsgD family transcriptional regulator